MIEEIECELKDIAEFSHHEKIIETKKGRYHGSMFWDVKDFGTKRWVVGGYLDVDYEPYLSRGYEKKEIVQLCVAYLNKTPPRKRFQKKTKKPLYGNLEPYDFRFKLGEKGEPLIEVLLITNQRKNENFWSEGPKMDS